MNELTALREAGPEAPALSPAARSAARAALLAEIDGPVRRRRPSRRTAWRLGAAGVAVGAAWTAAVVIAAPDGPGTPADSVRLVDFQMPTFPLSLDPVPDGLRPAFDGDGDGASIAAYDDPTGEHGFTLYVGDDEPELGDRDVTATEEVTVDGEDAELVRYSSTWCTGDDPVEDCPRRSSTWLTWERSDDQWVTLDAYGRYGTSTRMLQIAGSLVDRPQPATLDIGLAPAGWSVQFFKMGRVLTLVNDAYEQQEITVHVPLPEDVAPADQVRDSIMGPIGPQLDVVVHDRPAQLVLVDTGYLDQRGWFLQAQFADGTTFTLQAPDAFTQEQVLEFAEQVTHRP
ncbi:hypothetical protein [Modestobacter sp. VKM Ac-2978]|uniref:hypothetical protein n=1 Tax=Modestobacter sp. VKM Ac-2978 TaxID=3004132 RepID=UPI0022AA0A9F|nr:hypothetical protein [Modestobacter sp. VKM Ac-2978]MCZ2849519.1 hypothetical protein [Modestobacter sp. VKM Ac-2978]